MTKLVLVKKLLFQLSNRTEKIGIDSIGRGMMVKMSELQQNSKN